MKTDYYKTNNCFDVMIDNTERFYISDNSGNCITMQESDVVFLKKCIDDILDKPVIMCESGYSIKERVFIYSLRHLRVNYDNYDIADVIRDKIELQLKKKLLPMDGNMEFEILCDTVKVIYRWTE